MRANLMGLSFMRTRNLKHCYPPATNHAQAANAQSSTLSQSAGKGIVPTQNTSLQWLVFLL